MKVISTVIMIFILLFSGKSEAKESINWMIVDWPPFIILEGEDQGKGFTDEFLALYQKELPQYKHQQVLMNFARFWQGAKNGEPVCNALALKNAQREEYMYFSVPAAMTLSNSIIMKQENIAKLGSPKSYSLVKLMLDKQFVGILESGRSYSHNIGMLIEQHQASSNLIRGVNHAEQLLQMLELGRVDYIIEYPFVASYLQSKHMQQK